MGVIGTKAVTKKVERGSIGQKEIYTYSDASVGAGQRSGEPCKPSPPRKYLENQKAGNVKVRIVRDLEGSS